jgi:hypothetical protein
VQFKILEDLLDFMSQLSLAEFSRLSRADLGPYQHANRGDHR